MAYLVERQAKEKQAAAKQTDKISVKDPGQDTNMKTYACLFERKAKAKQTADKKNLYGLWTKGQMLQLGDSNHTLSIFPSKELFKEVTSQSRLLKLSNECLLLLFSSMDFSCPRVDRKYIGHRQRRLAMAWACYQASWRYDTAPNLPEFFNERARATTSASGLWRLASSDQMLIFFSYRTALLALATL